MLDPDAVYAKYAEPFRLIEELGLKCGYEKSFKLTQQQLLRNRYLLGIEKAGLDSAGLAQIYQRLEMPAEYIEDFLTGLADANLVLLGFEEGVEDCVYKIYLEYWDKIQLDIDCLAPPYQPRTMFIGYKWSALDSTRSAVTNYVYYPRINLDQIVSRLQALCASPDDDNFKVASEIIRFSASRAEPESFVYLEASEADNPRKSFDINLYQAGVELRSIYPMLAQLSRCYAISDTDLDELFETVSSRPLGHLSGGIDRQGKSFFTVYYETQSATPQ